MTDDATAGQRAGVEPLSDELLARMIQRAAERGQGNMYRAYRELQECRAAIREAGDALSVIHATVATGMQDGRDISIESVTRRALHHLRKWLSERG